MKKKTLFLVFLAIAVIQLIVPAFMVYNNEDTLTTGTLYKFKTEPVDPNDPFRGKYVTLRYDLNSFASNESWKRKTPIFIYIEKDENDFAKITTVSKNKMDSSNDYIIGKVRWYDTYTKKVNFRLPFDRFYMEETKAKPAETVFREAQRDSLPNNTYALVAVKNGHAVLKDVLVNEKSLAAYVVE